MSADKGGGGSFEERLRAARNRQGLDAPPPHQSGGQGEGPSTLAVGLRVGVEMVSALVVAVAIGWALDRWLGTRPILLAVGVLLGGAAGVANVWRLMGLGAARQGQETAKGGPPPGGPIE